MKHLKTFEAFDDNFRKDSARPYSREEYSGKVDTSKFMMNRKRDSRELGLDPEDEFDDNYTEDEIDIEDDLYPTELEDDEDFGDDDDDDYEDYENFGYGDDEF
jgi:hypothetical protein